MLAVLFLLLLLAIPAKAGIQRLLFDDTYFTESLTGEATGFRLDRMEGLEVPAS